MINNPLVRIIYSVEYIILWLIWFLLKYRFPRIGPVFPFLFLFNQCLFVYLSYNNWVPQFLINEDKESEEMKIFIAVVISHSVNYNSFLVTLIVQPLIVFPFAYLALRAQVKIRSDPYDGEPLENDNAYLSS